MYSGAKVNTPFGVYLYSFRSSFTLKLKEMGVLQKEYTSTPFGVHTLKKIIINH